MGLALRPLTAISYLELCRNFEGEENAVSRFRKLSHTIWHCRYPIIWVPKHRYRVLVGPIQEATYAGIQGIHGYVGSEVVELNVQRGHPKSNTEAREGFKKTPEDTKIPVIFDFSDDLDQHRGDCPFIRHLCVFEG